MQELAKLQDSAFGHGEFTHDEEKLSRYYSLKAAQLKNEKKIDTQNVQMMITKAQDYCMRFVNKRGTIKVSNGWENVIGFKNLEIPTHV